MPDNQSLVTNLLAGTEFKDPKIKSLLEILAADLYGLDRQINPPTPQSVQLNPGGNVISVVAPGNFSVVIFENNIRLSWTPPGTDTFLYEIRLGINYDTAVILLTTANLSADIDPVSRFILTGANYTFWVATIDNLGNHSTPATLTITIPNIGTPVLSTTIVGNSVLLRWNAPTSTFSLKRYNVYRNGVITGTIDGTFDAIFEPVAGSYSYAIQAIDIVGNLSNVSGIITVILGDPTDFQIFSSLDSQFLGTRNKTIRDNAGHLFAILNTTETWNEHFASRGWTSIQSQLNAGYPLYFEPGP